ncbi:hypothetical protein GQF56_14990 [Rhodobacter sphaeroides]|jgi:hypothetical protein|uniref:hypothetical protein n=1 Tax=Cereibacter sphaeroides TaxID=1063 RepID=UPI00005C7D3A|nr:hypothetical protein [Cereibacter sphaeroides]MVX46305.1 hypothetical protein [Cereibacter sphaeroides]MVX49169.1 hypothetical protein [Cereibacter sphaeroides]QHA10209.1 hypothetical protein GQR99_00040 [Cereibacter sphaeroides]QHA12251.1 hypothetical protein GQY06_00040 [Cereibacter sphaeroides]QJC85194.1 hypothetical protein HGN32_13775 [Cereibacter sphaeroides]
MIIASPLIVSAFYLLYVSERDAGHKYGRYLRQQFESIAQQESSFISWESWVEQERRANDNYRYDVQRSLAIFILIGTYYAIACVFGSSALIKMLFVSSSASKFACPFIGLGYLGYAWAVLKYSRSMPKPVRDMILD